MSETALTAAGIQAAIDALGTMPPRSRIIVGFPGVPNHGCLQYDDESFHLVLVGRSAWEQIARRARPHATKEFPFGHLLGTEVEFFEPGWRDHSVLAARIVLTLTPRPA